MVSQTSPSCLPLTRTKVSFIVAVALSLCLWFVLETDNFKRERLWSTLKLSSPQHDRDIGSATEISNRGKEKRPIEEEGRIISLVGYNFTCLPSYSKYFRHIFVIMQFTARLGQREQEVEELYSCFFPNIKRYTFCDPQDAAGTKGGMNCLVDRSPDFTKRNRANPSWFQYDFMVHAMETERKYNGYLFMQEDLLVNFWNYPGRHDSNKVWRNENFADPDPDVWHQHANLSLDDTDTIKNFARLWTTTNVFPIDHIRTFVEGFSPEEQQRLFTFNSVNGERMFRMANSDIYYVPTKYRDALVRHLKRARELFIFHEVAVPITLDALIESNEYEILNGAALFRVEDSVEKIALYDPCFDYFHKFKTSKRREWEWMVESVFRYGGMIESWNCLDSGKNGLTSYYRIRDD